MFLLTCVSLSTGAGHALAQSRATINPRHEYNVKAVFLYSFGRYITWPKGVFASDDSPFVIGILGEDPFAGALDKISKVKKISNRSIVVRQWKTLDDYQPCQILFVPKTTAADEQSAAIRKLATKPVLIVGETPGFAKRGGTLNFFIEGKSVRFEISVVAMKRQKLSADGKLLKLATTVEGK